VFGVKGALSAADGHAHKSGGRQPAVGRICACDGDPLLRTDYVSPRTFASRTTVGLRRPLLVARALIVAELRLAVSESVPAPRGAYAPRSCVRGECVPAKKRYLRWTNERAQERRASARRGCLNPVQSRKFTTVGLRPPLLVGTTCVRRAKAIFAMHKRTCIRAAGVSPPWVGNASAMAPTFSR
jgi:hypothetical protein